MAASSSISSGAWASPAPAPAQCVPFPGITVGIPTFSLVWKSGMVTLDVGFPTFPGLICPLAATQNLHRIQYLVCSEDFRSIRWFHVDTRRTMSVSTPPHPNIHGVRRSCASVASSFMRPQCHSAPRAYAHAQARGVRAAIAAFIAATSASSAVTRSFISFLRGFGWGWAVWVSGDPQVARTSYR